MPSTRVTVQERSGKLILGTPPDLGAVRDPKIKPRGEITYEGPSGPSINELRLTFPYGWPFEVQEFEEDSQSMPYFEVGPGRSKTMVLKKDIYCSCPEPDGGFKSKCIEYLAAYFSGGSMGAPIEGAEGARPRIIIDRPDGVTSPGDVPRP